MTLPNILKAVENLKLDRPSTDEIPVTVGDLEVLYTAIRKLEKELEIANIIVEGREKLLNNQRYQIASLSILAESARKQRGLQEYL